ncbi:alanine racemase [Siculibacillus lacustris]|uniref:Alanine racemase n=1 Tax=Siculibacillus lacustris TaxID=1549641 RepID=A0A4Q9VWY7_9HYPH|nr:alanine racemase [Siculibacillus lacustris]TBW39794.1 alanine racemase [Siculibacillus lacustris]
MTESLAPLPSPVPAPTRLIIDLSALVANRRTIAARVAPGVEVAAVVKADAYGVGLEPVVTALAADGARTFFVAHVGEGIAARAILERRGHGDARVFVLNGLLAGTDEAYAAHRLSPVLGSTAEVEAWASFAGPRALGLDAALHVDTGMNRHGLETAEAAALAQRPELTTAAGIRLVMSHLACADEPAHPLNAAQIERFRAARALWPDLPGSLANSAGVFLDGATHHDLVRPGVAVYGGAIVSGAPSPMRPVVRLEATILQVRAVPAGETVGYGGRETTRRASRIAILSVGYADGFHRSASSADGAAGARGVLHGVAVPLIGRISMDLMAIDVTDVPSAARGDTVELIGATVTIQEVAARMGTIDYEVLTGLGRRYQRVHVGG